MESLAQDLRTMVRTPLTEAHVAAMRKAGTETTLAAGEVLFRTGDRMDRFCYVLEGEVAATDPVTGEHYGNATLGPGQFVGEISFLWDGALMLGAVAVSDTRLLCVPRDAMLELMRHTPEMSDIVITVMAARRRRLLESGRASLTLIGAEADRGIRAIASFAGRNRIPFRSLSLSTRPRPRRSPSNARLPRARPPSSSVKTRPSSTRPRARSPRASGSIWISGPMTVTTS